jgi:hypothetical protein
MTDQTDPPKPKYDPEAATAANLHVIPREPEREDGEITATETATIRTFKTRVVELACETNGLTKIMQLIPRDDGRLEIRHGSEFDRDETGLLTSTGPIVNRAEFYRAQHVVADIADD